jgi:hypothetical protein
MQYLLMCCFEDALWEKIPGSQRDEIMQAYGTWEKSVTESGHYRGGARLQSSSNAITLHERRGKLVVTDGPFAETKEQLGGYHLIECKGLDEAISIASRIPTLGVGGSIEIRALMSGSRS